MFFYLIKPFLIFRGFLIAAAVVPAAILLIKVYKADKLEKEPMRFLFSLALAGIISTFIALIAERMLGLVLNLTVDPKSEWYNILLYFVIVAVSEETSKFLLLYKRTWQSKEFNCQFDGVVYSVFVSLGFALWENISYVTMYGFGTALIRAVTAIPGHACFGVFMGIFYGIAKKYDYAGHKKESSTFRIIGLITAVLLHGFYDYAASCEKSGFQWIFISFVSIMFVISYVLVGKLSKNDSYIDRHYVDYEVMN